LYLQQRFINALLPVVLLLKKVHVMVRISATVAAVLADDELLLHLFL
jgi:hypothetical protein